MNDEPLDVGRGREATLRFEDDTFSRLQFRVVPVAAGWEVHNLSQHNPTKVNGEPLSAPRLLVTGDRISAGRTELVFLSGEQAEAAAAAAAAEPAGLSGPTLPAQEMVVSDPRLQALQGEVPVRARTRIGRDEGLDLRLPHPHVSRLHAELVVDRNGVNLHDRGAANGTWLNGARLARPALLQAGDQIGIGSYRLLFTGRSLRYQSGEGNLTLVAERLSRRVRDDAGREVVILDDVSLVIRPRELVALLGPSGSGKSTLMAALSGRAPASQGRVLVNGEDLYRQFEALKRDLALVPQRDVVHAGLTVRAALRFTARLRLPPDTSPDELERVVERTLEGLGLTERGDTRIGALSGGQVKRVSLANELIARPSLLFLDEVTSGLDEQTDREMMRCFRDVADSGKTVVCITHSLTNVDRSCDLVVFMARGGRLAFFGRPAEALEYFQVERLGDVYDALESRPAEEWQRRYRESPLYRTYVVERLAAQPRPSAREAVRPRRPLGLRLREGGRQLGILSQRYARLLLADRGALAFAGGQAALVALTLWVFFGDLGRREVAQRAVESANLLFLLGTSSIWMGCNNAAKEIVKERDILTRERDANLEPLAYYLSKCLVLGLLGLLQSLVLLGVARQACGLEGDWPLQLLLLDLSLLAGMTLGLLISAASRTTDMAVTIVPMVLIPQVIFAGGIGPLEGAAETVAELLISNYWTFEALRATLPDALTSLADPLSGRPLLGELRPVAGCVAALTTLSLLEAVCTCLVLYRGRTRR